MELVFLQAQIWHFSGKYSEAIKAYRGMLEDRPGLLRVRLELADAYRLSGNVGQAKYHLQLVGMAELPLSVRQSVLDYLDDIQQAERLIAQFSFSVIPDSNLNASTGDEAIDIFGLPFVLDENARKKSGVGLRARLYTRYLPPLNDRLGFLMELDTHHTQYDGKSFDDTIAAANLGPRIRFGKSNLALLASLSYRNFGGRTYSYGVGGTVRWDGSLGKRTLVQLSFTGQKIHNEFDPNRSSQFYSLKPLLRHGFSSTSYLDSYARLSRDKAKSNFLSSYSLALGVGLFKMFPDGLSTYFNIEYHWKIFDALNPAFGVRREDHLVTGSVEITKRDWSYLGFAPVLSVGYQKNFSSNEFYDFSRIRLFLTVTRTF